MDRSQPMELANMCMLYDEKGRVLVEEKILGENEKGIIFPGGHVRTKEREVERRQKNNTGVLCHVSQLCHLGTV